MRTSSRRWWYDNVMPTFVAERTFDSPVTPERFSIGSQKLAPCIAARDVTWISSILAVDGTRSVCTFEAPDAESLREANGVAGLPPFARVYAATVFKP
jgi:hypothetical protein